MMCFEGKLPVLLVCALRMLTAVVDEQEFADAEALVLLPVLQIVFNQHGQSKNLSEFRSGKGKYQQEHYVNSLLQCGENKGFLAVSSRFSLQYSFFSGQGHPDD